MFIFLILDAFTSFQFTSKNSFQALLGFPSNQSEGGQGWVGHRGLLMEHQVATALWSPLKGRAHAGLLSKLRAGAWIVCFQMCLCSNEMFTNCTWSSFLLLYKKGASVPERLYDLDHWWYQSLFTACLEITSKTWNKVKEVVVYANIEVSVKQLNSSVPSLWSPKISFPLKGI